jgi:hypothetical protein
MQMPQGMRCELVRGREAVPLGWVSRRFDQRTASPTVLVQGAIRGNARLLTRIELSIATARSEAHQRRAETAHV